MRSPDQLRGALLTSGRLVGAHRLLALLPESSPGVADVQVRAVRTTPSVQPADVVAHVAVHGTGERALRASLL